MPYGVVPRRMLSFLRSIESEPERHPFTLLLSRYASKSEWIIEADTDEFYVPTRAFTGVSLRNDPSIYECPIRPLPELLKNFIYKSADAIGVARVTFKNNGIVKLDDDASVLASQTMRDVYHAIPWAKLFFTKSLVHTKKKSGWIIPWAHGLKHVLLTPSQVKIINVVGEPAPGLVMNDPTNDNPGTFYEGKLLTRAFEPLVSQLPSVPVPLHSNTVFCSGLVSEYFNAARALAVVELIHRSPHRYHYVQRDLSNCLTKLARASVVRKGGWRDTAGEEGCKDYEMYQDKDGSKEIFETNSFCTSFFISSFPSLNLGSRDDVLNFVELNLFRWSSDSRFHHG